MQGEPPLKVKEVKGDSYIGKNGHTQSIILICICYYVVILSTSVCWSHILTLLWFTLNCLVAGLLLMLTSPLAKSGEETALADVGH